MNRQFQLRHAILTSVLAVLLYGCPAVEVEVVPTLEVEDSYTVKKSPNDDRSYRYLELDNGIDVMLIRKETADKSAASLVIARGSQHDPDEHLGLAHFLEHMLFLGTEKYPLADEYQEFIQKHGGGLNAYTAPDHTNYFFEIDPAYLDEGIDRFAQFFIAPLLDATYVEREKNAVHSEYQMQKKVDGWRLYTAWKLMMDRDYDGARFSIGSLETLKNTDENEVRQFMDDSYSADQMLVVLYDRRPIDDMERLVRQTFTPIQNKQLGTATPEVAAFNSNSLPSAIGVKTIMNQRSLAISWPIPPIQAHYRSKPDAYLANLIGHEGEGSLFKYLLDQGWATALAAYSQTLDENNAVFEVDITLTEEGWRFKSAVRGLVFDYIETLRSSGIVQDWRQEERIRLDELAFQNWQESGSAIGTVNAVAQALLYYEPSDILIWPYTVEPLNPTQVVAILDHLTRDNSVTMISGPDVETDITEEHFGVEYTLDPDIDLDFHSTGQFELPVPNPYIPEDTSLISATTVSEKPTLVSGHEELQVWHASDTSFGVPYASVNLYLNVPGGISSPDDTVHAQLFSNLLSDHLNATLYPARLANFATTAAPSRTGFAVSAYGYSDKIATVFETLIEAFSGFELKQDRFDLYQLELDKTYGNFKDQRPYQQTMATLSHVLVSNSWSPASLQETLQGVSLASLIDWREQHLSEVSGRMLVSGNVSAEQVEELETILRRFVRLEKIEKIEPEVAEMSGLYVSELEIDHTDAAYFSYFQSSDTGLVARAYFGLIGEIISSSYFNQLRTEKQLGYVVNAGSRRLQDRPGLAFIVQSPTASAPEINDITEAFIEEEKARIDNMSEAEFSDYVNGYMSDLLEEDKNLPQRISRYQNDLLDENYNFDTREQFANVVQNARRSELSRRFHEATEGESLNRLIVYSMGAQGQILLGGVRADDETLKMN